MLPRLPGFKVVVFCKRIVVLSETFAPVGGSKNGKDKATGVLWHEGIRGRSDIISNCRQSLVMNATTFSTLQKEFLNPITLVKSLNLNKYR